MSGLFSNDLVILCLSYLEGKKLSYFSALGALIHHLIDKVKLLSFWWLKTKKKIKT